MREVDGKYFDAQTNEEINWLDMNKYRTAQEDKLVQFYLMKQQIVGESAKLSNSYNAGESSKEMFKFIFEMIASRGAGRFISGATKIKLGSNFVTHSQATIDRWMKINKVKKLPTSVVIQDGAASTLGFLLQTGFQTSTVGYGRIDRKYWENMTAEMNYVWTTVDGVDNGMEFIMQIDRLGFPTEDANGLKPHEDGWDPETGYDETRSGAEAFANAWAHTWVDYSTEYFGAVFRGKKVLPKEMIDDPSWFKRVIVGRTMKMLGLGPDDGDELVAWFKRQGGFDGAIGEFAEELLAEPGHSIIDGRPIFSGLDRDWFETTAIAVIGGQFTMGTAGKVKTVIGNQIGGKKFPPSYNITLKDGTVFKYDNAQDALGAITTLQEEGLIDIDTEIEINNDFEGAALAEQLLGTDLEGIVKSSSFGNVINDAVTGNDIMVVDQVSEEVANTVIELRQEQEKTEEIQK